MIAALKALQLAVAAGVVVLFWQIYPGILLLLVGAVGLVFLIASIAALRDRRAGIWLAFAFSVLTAVLGSWGVYRYLDNGFDYLAGNFPGRPGLHWPAYLFLLVALGAVVVVALHGVTWPWMARPHARRSGRGQPSRETRRPR